MTNLDNDLIVEMITFQNLVNIKYITNLNDKCYMFCIRDKSAARKGLAARFHELKKKKNHFAHILRPNL